MHKKPEYPSESCPVSIKKSPSKTSQSKSSKPSVSRPTRAMLRKKRISVWQACLREGISQKEILSLLPDLSSEIEKNPTPPLVPKWAGGKGRDLPKKQKELSWEDAESIHLGAISRELLPFEACFRFAQTGETIRKLLSDLDITVEAGPAWLPSWTCPLPKKTISEKHEELYKKNIKKSPWNSKEKETLAFYWKLELLGSHDVALLMEKNHKQVVSMAKRMKLKEKPERSAESWCGLSWAFTPDTDSDPKLLSPLTQRLVAEASATRFSLLYEKLDTLEKNDSSYRTIEKELNSIVELHSRIFSKYISIKSRKYRYQGTSSWQVQKDLEQAGRAAIFECLRRWHPNRNIRFSRGAVCIAITREMIAWVEQQRLVELPDKIRSVARKLKHAQDNGTLDVEYERLKEEAGEGCVREASKHKHSYAYISTVPILDEYDEDLMQTGAVSAGIAECKPEFLSFNLPEQGSEVIDILLEASEQLPHQERTAILAYHGINIDGTHCSTKTLEEIGETEGVTKERIRQRIVKGMERMKRFLNKKNICSTTDALMHC
jgi:RNA polymerase sigma factor (sigma-70 family)